MPRRKMSGAAIVLKALRDRGVDTIFGYPGGAVLPLYDEMFKENSIRHILVRHEQGAVHAAEGYARSTGKVGVVLVTSGPGATNTVTGLTDAMMDSIPLVCITGQVPTHMIGNDAFQEADTVGITRPCTKHNYLVRDVVDLERTIHEAFYIAKSGRPGPVVIDIPKNVQIEENVYKGKIDVKHKTYKPQIKGNKVDIDKAIDLLMRAHRPIFYVGGGVINSGPKASKILTEFIHLTGFPCTSTLMGLGCFPTRDRQFLGMLGMHGTYEANLAMHGCDVMFAVGARFDDRITGKVSDFSPGSKKIHLDIDASSFNKSVQVDQTILGDVLNVIEEMLKKWKKKKGKKDHGDLKDWWKTIATWRAKKCLSYKNSRKLIKPQYALERLDALTKNHDTFITTEVGQHQMWAAQYLNFSKPNRWMTSGGLGTMGYGLPAAMGVQLANPKSLVIDVAGEASVLMNIQELSTIMQYRLPVKIFILNNRYMGMVRQWQELLHGGRYSESYMDSLPDFVMLAESFGAVGLRAKKPKDVDSVIKEMIRIKKPVIADICIDETENCFPMIPSGSAHNEMLLGPEDHSKDKNKESAEDNEGMILV
jgi:acetolactate synthase-1/2/3 large subunit|tara:strand:+ start:1873 stop:3648 length:1776 start_codon:yes stop_codon:yes gene_type:complete